MRQGSSVPDVVRHERDEYGFRWAELAHRRVDTGAKAGGHLEVGRFARVGPHMDSRGHGRREVAVGGECSPSRQTHLSTVGVPGKDNLSTVVLEGVEDSLIRSMCHTQRGD